jgi:hypothetical protein
MAAVNTPVKIKTEEEDERPRQPDYIEKYDPYDEGALSVVTILPACSLTGLIQRRSPARPCDQVEPRKTQPHIYQQSLLNKKKLPHPVCNPQFLKNVYTHLLMAIPVDEYRPSKALLESFAKLEQSRIATGMYQ